MFDGWLSKLRGQAAPEPGLADLKAQAEPVGLRRAVPFQQHATPELDEDGAFAELERRLQPERSPFASAGFQRMRTVVERRGGTARWRAFLNNADDTCRVWLVYTYPEQGAYGSERGGFTLHIVNDDFQSLNVERWLRVKGESDDALLFLQTTGETDFNRYFDEFFAMLRRHADTDLQSILRAEAWETVLEDEWDEFWEDRWDDPEWPGPGEITHLGK